MAKKQSRTEFYRQALAVKGADFNACVKELSQGFTLC